MRRVVLPLLSILALLLVQCQPSPPPSTPTSTPTSPPPPTPTSTPTPPPPPTPTSTPTPPPPPTPIPTPTCPPPREVFLEIDKLEGTEFPPSSVTEGGATHTLASVYAQCNIDLDIRQDDTLPGPDELTDSQLYGYYLAQRNSAYAETATKWSAYVLVAKRYKGARDALGQLFDLSERRGAAIFYGALQDYFGADQAKFNREFLMTVAHELGHEFNLHHEDVAQGGTSIMNYSSTPKVQFTWSDHSCRHLSCHPATCVKPGGSPLYAMNSEHRAWHSNPFGVPPCQ